jgi:hypothetical protein
MPQTAGKRNRVVMMLLLIGLLVTLAVPVAAEPISQEKLEAHGWTCGLHRAFGPAPSPRIACYNPGQGAPVIGIPEQAKATYNYAGFDPVTGEYIGHGHAVRDDVFNDQPCKDGWFHLALIGFYECFHPVGGNK